MRRSSAASPDRPDSRRCSGPRRLYQSSGVEVTESPLLKLVNPKFPRVVVAALSPLLTRNVELRAWGLLSQGLRGIPDNTQTRLRLDLNAKF